MVAIGDAYATAAEYRAVVNMSDTSEDATTIARDLLAVSRYIEQELGRVAGFNKDASAVDRIYMPRGRVRYGYAEAENPWLASNGTRVLDVDDIVSVTSIKVDQDIDDTFSLTLATTDYELLPRNAADGPEARPYRQIELTPWGTQSVWRPGARVKVNAVFGWPAVPSAIKDATIQLTAILRLQSPRATNRVNEMNQSLSTSRVAQEIVAGLLAAYLDPKAIL